VGEGADGAVGVAVGFAGALGGVLGDVAGQSAVGDLAVLVGDGVVGGGGDLAQVELRAPVQGEGGAVGPGGVEAGRGGCFVDGVAQGLGGEPGRWWVGGSVGAVEADRGVEVDEPAALRIASSDRPAGRDPRPPGSNFLYLVKAAPRPRRRKEEQEPRR
jgi:hypothetical protein